MTRTEAEKFISDFNANPNPSEEEEFCYTEALEYLISETKNPHYMMELGGFYYEKKNFDLALKYYEQAKSYDFLSAHICLGYIWYYGRTGTRDFEKAFDCFSRGMKKGDLVSTYKVADMYKNGYGVEKNYEVYKSMIEDLYPKVQNCRYVDDPVPEVYTRLARIRKEEGNAEEAIRLYLHAKDFLAQRIKYNAFFGNLNIMKWLIEDLYTLVEADDADFDFYDLFYFLKKPCTIRFRYNRNVYEVEAKEENGEVNICFQNVWYRTVDDFIHKACIGNEPLTHIAADLYDFEVL